MARYQAHHEARPKREIVDHWCACGKLAGYFMGKPAQQVQEWWCATCVPAAFWACRDRHQAGPCFVGDRLVVAYSFKTQFGRPIITGTKRQTIRAERKRHAREGEKLQLFTGMRTQYCRLLGTATCTLSMNIRLDLEAGRVESMDTGSAWTTAEEIEHFARQDGFTSWRQLRFFWAAAHPDVDVFSGVLISWGETFEAAHG